MTQPVKIAKPWVWAYLLSPVGLLVVFFIVPMLFAFAMSLLDYSQSILHPRFVGAENYTQLLTSPVFWRVIWNTLVFTALLVPAMVVVPLPVAVLVNQPLKGMTIFRALIYLPVVVSVVVAGIAWKWLYAPDGLLNFALSFMGLAKIGWLIWPETALAAVGLMIVWKGLGYYMMMYLASLQSVSKELYEAAEVDGAGLWQKHWHVTLAHLRPTMAMVAIIATIGSLKVFTEIYVMTQGGPIGSTETMVYYIYDQAFAGLNLGVASAAGFILMAVILVLSLLNINRLYLKAETEARLA